MRVAREYVERVGENETQEKVRNKRQVNEMVRRKC